MTTIGVAARRNDLHHLGHNRESPYRQHTEAHAERGAASKRIVTGYGFWIFLLSDIIMFSAFFAAYAVLVGATAGDRAAGSYLTWPTSGSRRGSFSPRASPAASQAIGARARSRS
jgi:cytochrome o ubiquinol oxidase subunit III